MLDINLGQIFITFLVLLFSLTVHESAHAWTADRLGDPTARMLGRISLNPAVHVDPIGTVLFPLIAILTHLPLLGWAKPVPVNGRYLQNYRRDFLLIAAAGPASNLMLATIGALLLRVMPLQPATVGQLSISAPLTSLIVAAVYINVLLAVFNMIPIPPLDGGNVLAGLLPARMAHDFDRVRPYGFMLLYALMFTGALNYIVGLPSRLLFQWML